MLVDELETIEQLLFCPPCFNLSTGISGCGKKSLINYQTRELLCKTFRCVRCRNSAPETTERCSHSPPGTPKVRLRKFSRKSDSYELFSDEMGSNRTGEVNCKIYSEGRETLTKSKPTGNAFSPERNGTDSHKSRQASQTPEYVKRTAKLFETVQISEEIEIKNGVMERYATETYANEKETVRKAEKESRKISLDCLDGEFNKKPSYVGVSCSNSGYRNVINYDSKLREGFWTANSQRESLVLSSSRLRESSPLRRDFEFAARNGSGRDSVKITDIRIETEGAEPVNGVSQPEKFVNISTSTKTISTFRNSKDVKGEEWESRPANGARPNGSAETKVNLKQILNGKSEEPSRKGYSSLGFSPKILKSPEKNCNSFLKSISSFENNCRKSSGTERSSTYAKTEQKICESNNSILQRIERLYGPGALAQGFYAQKPQSKLFEKSDESSLDGDAEVSPQQSKPQTLVATPVNSTTSNNLPKAPPPEVTQTEIRSNGHATDEPLAEDSEGSERNGHYFLRLLKKETDRLEQLASFAEAELENGENLQEEVSGKLRAAAGKARLLVCQKLNQFEGLCHKNLNEKPGEQFPTTSEDLAGFWDMVMLQVVQVYGVFDELEQLKKNNWKATPIKKSAASPATNGQSTKTTPRKSTPANSSAEKQSQKSDSARKAREEGRRKLLEERRKKMKELKENKIVNGDNEVEIFAK